MLMHAGNFDSDMSLEDYLHDKYVLQRELKSSSVDQIEWSIKNFRKFLNRSPRLSDLSDTQISKWVKWLAENRSPKYTQNCRGNILSLWRAAVKSGDHSVLPTDQVRNITVPPKIPRAWTMDQLKALLVACDGPWLNQFLPNGIHKGRWWRVAILVGYDTALRGCDIFNKIRFEQIESDGSIEVVQEKTGYPHRVQLESGTLEEIKRISRPEREFVLAWPYRDETLRKQFLRLCKDAGIKGTMRWLRRSAASHLEAVQPGFATQLLGHKTPTMAVKHYIDPRIARAKPVAPPRFSPLDDGR